MINHGVSGKGVPGSVSVHHTGPTAVIVRRNMKQKGQAAQSFSWLLLEQMFVSLQDTLCVQKNNLFQELGKQLEHISVEI